MPSWPAAGSSTISSRPSMYRSIVALTTAPPAPRAKILTSVQAPAKSTRTGARLVTITKVSCEGAGGFDSANLQVASGAPDADKRAVERLLDNRLNSSGRNGRHSQARAGAKG